MSRTEARRWLILGLAAFILRAGAAILTEHNPLFPSYYYHDAVFVERIAWDMAETWRAGRAYRTPYAPPQRAHAALLAVPYAVVGRLPLVNKLINALLGAAAAVLLGLAFRSVVRADAAFAAGALVAAWPSHVFNTSQNFKEAPTLALVYAALALLLPALAPGAKPSASRAASAVVLLALAGLLRSYVLAVVALALAFGAVLALRRKPRSAAAFALAAALAAPFVCRGAGSLLFGRLLASPEGIPATLPPMAPIALPAGPPPAPWTPAGLSLRRAQGQASDRAYAQKTMARDVGTQIEPDARLETWLDVARFLPSAAFQALFMPLPGLYPMDGKLGRRLAALENVLLLALTAGALLGLARSGLSPAGAVTLAFFLAMTAGSALMEFDLGSASRHKLLFMPMIFPFAAEELLRRRRG